MKSVIGRSAKFGMLIAAMLGGTEVSSPSFGASTCYTSSNRPVCACSSCQYFVICGLTVGWPPNATVNICTGTNPGKLAPWYATGPSGLTSTACSISFGCGTATATGRCCGGARITFPDWRSFTRCGPSGSECKTGGTGTQ